MTVPAGTVTVSEADALRMESSRLERELALSLYSIGWLAGVASHGQDVPEERRPQESHIRAGWESGREMTAQALGLYAGLLAGTSR